MSPIHNTQDAFKILKPLFNSQVEEFWVLTLNSELKLTQQILLNKGTLNYCFVHPRDLFREVILANSFAFLMAHNHPSLNPRPTSKDINFTKKIIKLSKTLEINCLDHLIFTNESYFSFKENKLV